MNYQEWSAALTVSSVCLSILSMLSSATKKARPFNDAEFCKRSQGRGPKAFLWQINLMSVSIFLSTFAKILKVFEDL